MKLAILVTLAACSFSHRLEPVAPTSVAAPPVKVTLDHVDASPLTSDVNVWVTVESNGPPATFEGSQARLEVDGFPASYEPTGPIATGGGSEPRPDRRTTARS